MFLYALLILSSIFVNTVGWMFGSAEEELTVAIVGAGIGGASTAHFVREKYPNATIIVFEKERAGGRIKSDDFEGQTVEVGASTWQRNHRYMNSFCSILGIETKDPRDGRGSYGIWNGKDIVFRQSSSSFKMVLSMIRRYGLSPLYCQSLVSELVDNYNDIYEIVNDPSTYPPWESIEEILRHIELYDMSQETMKSVLRDRGFTAAFIDEMIEGILRNNFGQSSAEVNAMAGLLSLKSGADDLRTAIGGNKAIVTGLLQKAQVKLEEEAHISSILMNDPALLLTKPDLKALMVSYEQNGKILQKDVDVVFIAAPLDLAGIELFTDRRRRKKADDDDASKYILLHVTMLTANCLSPHYFRLLRSDTDPSYILTMNEEVAIFNSLTVTHQVPDQGQSAYKVLSREPLSEEDLDKIFINKTSVVRHSWHAYPSLKPTMKYPLVRLGERLYHPAGIEHALPLMEAAAVSAMNSVNLMIADRNGWKVFEPPTNAEQSPPSSPPTETVTEPPQEVPESDWGSWFSAADEEADEPKTEEISEPEIEEETSFWSFLTSDAEETETESKPQQQGEDEEEISEGDSWFGSGW